MYAQLCKRLAENAPNHDPPDSKTTTFRRLLLNKCRDEFENRARIAQQYDKLTSSSPSSNPPSAGNDEQKDARFLAKRKMLGNIKFIGELGKLQIVHDSILHRCCEQLLVGRKKQSLPEQAEDLECFCHLMRTCGRILDTPKAKVLMDQYFERLRQATENDTLPQRIRFIIQDILEMRRNKWMPRKLGKAPEGPRTIQQVREDAYREGCVYIPQQSPPNSSGLKTNTSLSSSMINPLEGSFFDNKSRKGMGDLFGGYSGYLGTGGPGTIQTDNYDHRGDGQQGRGMNGAHSGGGGRGENERNSGGFSPSSSGGGGGGNNAAENSHGSSNGQHRHHNSNRDNFGPSGDHYNNHGPQQHQREKLPDFGDRYSANRNKDRERRQQQQFAGGRGGGGGGGGHQGNDERRFSGDRFNNMTNQGGRGSRDGGHQDGGGGSGGGGEYSEGGQGSGSLPPRFKKMAMGQGSKDMEVSLRPQTANNMLLKPKTPSMLPKSAISKHEGSSPLGENSLLGSQPKILMMQPNEPPMIKQAPLDKGRRGQAKGGDKGGPTREEVFAKMEAILAELLEHKSTNEAAERWKEGGWLPSKMSQTAVTHFIKISLSKPTPEERDLSNQLLAQLMKDGAINSTHVQEALGKLVSQLADLEKDCADARANIAGAGAWAVAEKAVSLREWADLARGGQGSYPVMLLALQAMLKNNGSEAELKAQYDAAGLKMVDFVPEESRGDDALADILEAHQLSFLMPLLGVQQDMARQLRTDPNPTTFQQWITEHVSPKFFAQPAFVTILFNLVAKHIFETVTKADQPNQPASASEQPDKALAEAERECLGKFRPVLQPFVRSSPELQLAAVYALQVFCHEMGFPKGLLLRSFVNFYELDIMDEQAYLRWKEDVNDAYPGKGKALFQVNQWLTWLEEAESEEEEDDNDE